jgi:hypothetical protein
MAKERFYQKKRKKMIKIGVFSLILILILGFIMFTGVDINENVVNGDLTPPPNHKDFIGYRFFENLEELPISFTFVDEETRLIDNYFTASQYTYKRSSGVLFYKGLPESTVTGGLCNEQELIRFTYCDNSLKSSCKEDIFANLWLVNSARDYPDFNGYNPAGKFNNAFFYTYSCYESEKYKAITVPDDVEKRYLYNNQCINAKDSNFLKGTNYATEFKCLEALKIKIETEQENVCTARTYDSFVCNNDRVYQQERQTDCTIDFTEYVRRCYYGCDGGECLPKPEQTCTYQEFDTFKCIDDIKYQLVRERDCSEDYTNPIGACDIPPVTPPVTPPIDKEETITCDACKFTDNLWFKGVKVNVSIGSECSDDGIGSYDFIYWDTDVFPNSQTGDYCTFNGVEEGEGGGGKLDLNCLDYEDVNKNNKCAFSIIKSLTADGFDALYKDKPATTILAILIFLVLVYFIATGMFNMKSTKGGKK